MSPLIHLISAWLIAVLFKLDLKERRLVMWAGIILDIDAVFILYSQEFYIKYHHGITHSLVFGIPFAIIASFMFIKEGKNKVITASAGILAFSVHLIEDIIGTNWPIQPFSPLSEASYSIYPMLSMYWIYSVLNPIFAAMILVIMAVVIVKKWYSPVELISKKLDGIFTGFFTYPLKYKCAKCGKKASYRCEVCNQYYCARHVDKFFATKCSDCDGKNRHA
jgi:membrane-bound metal-dependent hydrolase YbcI (DUF457 family)